MRLNQAISRTGYCSRRNADELIAAGKVKVNGKVVLDFSCQIDPDMDDLVVEGKKLQFSHLIYVAMNKPPGVVTTMSDESGRETVVDLLPGKLKSLKPVGRLDMYSEGLLILTNDGHFAQQLTYTLLELSWTMPNCTPWTQWSSRGGLGDTPKRKKGPTDPNQERRVSGPFL